VLEVLKWLEQFKGLGSGVCVITKLNLCLGVFDWELTSTRCEKSSDGLFGTQKCTRSLQKGDRNL
jgi:hypothetical protein